MGCSPLHRLPKTCPKETRRLSVVAWGLWRTSATRQAQLCFHVLVKTLQYSTSVNFEEESTKIYHIIKEIKKCDFCCLDNCYPFLYFYHIATLTLFFFFFSIANSFYLSLSFLILETSSSLITFEVKIKPGGDLCTFFSAALVYGPA